MRSARIRTASALSLLSSPLDLIALLAAPVAASMMSESSEPVFADGTSLATGDLADGTLPAPPVFAFGTSPATGDLALMDSRASSFEKRLSLLPWVWVVSCLL